MVFGLLRCLNSLHLFWISQCTLYLENFLRLANFMKYFLTTERKLNPNPRIHINSKPAHHILFFFESFLLIKNDVAEKSFRKWIFVSTLFLFLLWRYYDHKEWMKRSNDLHSFLSISLLSKDFTKGGWYSLYL